MGEMKVFKKGDFGQIWEDFEGVLLVDKPKGVSSFFVVTRVRAILSKQAGKRVKVGHAGTLDPFATGLLILLVGKGTKKAESFLKLDKSYVAEMRLGATSETLDVEGEIVEKMGVRKVEETELKEVIAGFKGEIEQKVPAFSAVKIKGRRAYDLARKGMEVEMPIRRVKIKKIELLRYEWPEATIYTEVSSGTYIRALGADIGEKLGVGAYLTNLRRMSVGEFRVEEAVSLEEMGVELKNDR